MKRWLIIIIILSLAIAIIATMVVSVNRRPINTETVSKDLAKPSQFESQKLQQIADYLQRKDYAGFTTLLHPTDEIRIIYVSNTFKTNRDTLLDYIANNQLDKTKVSYSKITLKDYFDSLDSFLQSGGYDWRPTRPRWGMDDPAIVSQDKMSLEIFKLSSIEEFGVPETYGWYFDYQLVEDQWYITGISRW